MGEAILRELVSSASGSTVKAVLAPVLNHCDLHSLWEESKQAVKAAFAWFLFVVLHKYSLYFQLAVHIFEVIMFSIQIDHSYIVIERVISHIEKAKKPVAESCMAQVIHLII